MMTLKQIVLGTLTGAALAASIIGYGNEEKPKLTPVVSQVSVKSNLFDDSCGPSRYFNEKTSNPFTIDYACGPIDSNLMDKLSRIPENIFQTNGNSPWLVFDSNTGAYHSFEGRQIENNKEIYLTNPFQITMVDVNGSLCHSQGPNGKPEPCYGSPIVNIQLARKPFDSESSEGFNAVLLLANGVPIFEKTFGKNFPNTKDIEVGIEHILPGTYKMQAIGFTGAGGIAFSRPTEYVVP